MDAITLTPINTTKKTMIIIVCLFADRLFFTPFGQERKGAFSRLVVALAHEIYGNVQSFLEMPLENQELMTPTLRQDLEIRAFTRSVAFLEGLFENPLFLRLPSKTQADLRALLPREQSMLQSWETGNARACKKDLEKPQEGPQKP